MCISVVLYFHSCPLQLLTRSLSYNELGDVGHVTVISE